MTIKKKVIGLASLTLVLALPLSASAFNNGQTTSLNDKISTPAIGTPATEAPEEGGGYSLQVRHDDTFDTVLSGSSKKLNFNVEPGYGYVKVSVKNTGNKPLRFTVQHYVKGIIGKEVSVPANSSVDWLSTNVSDYANKGVPGGNYTVQFVPTSGYYLSGQAWAITATQKTDL